MASWLTDDFTLALLNLPPEGILGVDAALLLSRKRETSAYWWRDQQGQQHVRLIDPQALRAAVGNMPFDSGYLPAHTLRVGMTRTGKRWMAVFQPPRSYRLTLELAGSEQRVEQQTIELGLPGCVVFGKAETYWVWAVKAGPLTTGSHLYCFPLPNISEEGLLCFGENTPPPVDWNTFLSAFFLFVDSPFNGHWAQGKSTRHAGDIRERLLQLGRSQADPPLFPEDELVQLPPTWNQFTPRTLDGQLRALLEER